MKHWDGAFLMFYWLIGFISFVIIVYICVSSLPHREVIPQKVIVMIQKVPPPLPMTCPHSPTQSRSLYGENFSFDLHALLRGNETDLGQESEILWTKRGLTYGDLQSVHRFNTNVSIAEVSTDSSKCS